MVQISYNSSSIDGVGLAGHLRTHALIARTIFWHYPHYHDQGSRPARALRTGPRKYIEHYEDHRIELYDVTQDIEEHHNIANNHPNVVQEMRTKLSGWRGIVKAQMAWI